MIMIEIFFKLKSKNNYSIYRHNDLSRFTNKTVHAAVTHARKVKKVFRRKTGSA